MAKKKAPASAPKKRVRMNVFRQKVEEPLPEPKPVEETEWLIPFEIFESKENARQFRDQVENNIKLARYQRLISTLVEKSAVERLSQDVMRHIADNLQQMVDRHSGEIAALTDPKQVRSFLQARISEAFIRASGTWVMPNAVLEADITAGQGLLPKLGVDVTIPGAGRFDADK